MVTDIEGMKKIKANITEVNLVAVPKLVSKINSVACVSFNVATYSQSTLPNVAKATTALTAIATNIMNRLKYHHSALHALPLNVAYFSINEDLIA
tara:strand:+ start:117 stop:401 length:285 start_codon:yes stop_codon:yes gene_type:complete